MWVERMALTSTSPRDHTICGSSFGSKVIVLINSAGLINCTTSSLPGPGMRRRWKPSCLSKRIGSLVAAMRSEEHTSELQSRPHLVCRLLLEKKKQQHYLHLFYIKKNKNTNQ